MPDRVRASICTADMVVWLSHFMEMGVVPDEIELMHVLPSPVDATKHWYLYRFRSECEYWAQKGWMAGVYGPVLRDAEPSASGTGASRYRPWDAKLPKEHFMQIIGDYLVKTADYDEDDWIDLTYY